MPVSVPPGHTPGAERKASPGAAPGDSERGQHVHRPTWIAVLALVAVVAIALIVGGWSWDSPTAG
jgi:hypothetical protein